MCVSSALRKRNSIPRCARLRSASSNSVLRSRWRGWVTIALRAIRSARTAARSFTRNLTSVSMPPSLMRISLTLSLSVNGDQGLPLLNGLPRFDAHRADFAVARGFQLVLHLHRFEDDQRLAFLHVLPRSDVDGDDQAGHGRFDHDLAAGHTQPTRRFGQPPRALVLDAHRVKAPAQQYPDLVAARFNQRFMRFVIEQQ